MGERGKMRVSRKRGDQTYAGVTAREGALTSTTKRAFGAAPLEKKGERRRGSWRGGPKRRKCRGSVAGGVGGVMYAKIIHSGASSLALTSVGVPPARTRDIGSSKTHVARDFGLGWRDSWEGTGDGKG
ncbi:hypothetical protein B0H11DRAFT_1936845 [Mycena galericulata]|nr:hypothetical protein B0H11DRAFT_1936845 [Mycena galericulata]